MLRKCFSLVIYSGCHLLMLFVLYTVCNAMVLLIMGVIASNDRNNAESPEEKLERMITKVSYYFDILQIITWIPRVLLTSFLDAVAYIIMLPWLIKMNY